MLKKLFFLLLLFAAGFLFIVKAQNQDRNDNRDADRAAIRASIEEITQAFIDGNIDKIYVTHSKDWSGFLDGGPPRPRGSNDTELPIQGIDEYMKANGINNYPRPANAPKFTPNPNAATRGFKIYNFNVNFVSPDVGVASFILDFGNKSDGDIVTNYRLQIMDVYAKRDGNWIQVASHTVVDPKWRSERNAQPAINILPQIRQQILDARQSVWRAWFANDRPKLEELIPDDAIAIASGDKNWQNRAAILDDAKKFADSGAKLIRLEFPRTDIQIYGSTIILYTSYLFETEKDGTKTTNMGKGIETFVRRNGKLVNTGWLLAGEK